MAYIDSGKNDGAIVHSGGQRHGESGYFVQPTIFTDCKPDMKIMKEEIFGPVAAVAKFKTEEGKAWSRDDITRTPVRYWLIGHDVWQRSSRPLMIRRTALDAISFLRIRVVRCGLLISWRLGRHGCVHIETGSDSKNE